MHGRGLSEDRKKGHRRLMFRPPSRLISSLEASGGSSSLSLSSPSSFSKVINSPFFQLDCLKIGSIGFKVEIFLMFSDLIGSIGFKVLILMMVIAGREED